MPPGVTPGSCWVPDTVTPSASDRFG
ncbi:hypothetical protein STRTUCAR8_04411, partial [Streptomyces turgidiscabies Car8]